MTDHELIAYLKRQGLDKDIAAANRIEELVKEQARLHAGWHEANVNKLIAKLKLDKAVEALRGILKGDDVYPCRIAREVLAELGGGE